MPSHHYYPQHQRQHQHKQKTSAHMTHPNSTPLQPTTTSTSHSNSSCKPQPTPHPSPSSPPTSSAHLHPAKENIPPPCPNLPSMIDQPLTMSSNSSSSSSTVQTHCVNLGRRYLHALHADVYHPFVLPPALQRTACASAILEMLLDINTKANNCQLCSSSDTILLAIAECFIHLDKSTTTCTPTSITKPTSTTTFPCDICLAANVLYLPTTTQATRRAKHVLLDLLITVTSFHALVTLSPSKSSTRLIDALYHFLHNYFSTHLYCVLDCTDSTPSTSMPVNALPSSHKDITCTSISFEDTNHALLALQILTNLARQACNHPIVLSHNRLILLLEAMVSHPLVDVHILRWALLFFTANNTFVASLSCMQPYHLLIDAVVTILETCAGKPQTSLIGPLYVTTNSDCQYEEVLISTTIQILMTYCQHTNNDSQCLSRLLRVLSYIMLQPPNSTPLSSAVAPLANVIVQRFVHLAAQQYDLVLALIQMSDDVHAGDVAKEALLCLHRELPDASYAAQVHSVLERHGSLPSVDGANSS